MNIFTIEHILISRMDHVVDDKLKIGWHQGGSDIRGVLNRAINVAFKAGRTYEQKLERQRKCKHDIAYNRTGGTCRLCGYNDLHCSSD